MKLRYNMVNCYVVRPAELAGTHELLQLRRAPGEPLAGAWSVCRGGIEDGETAWQAALRELAEETGLDVAVGEVFQVTSGYRRPQLDVCYLCRHLGGTFRPDAEIAAMRFCALDELPPDLHPNQRPIIARAHALWRGASRQ